MTLREQKAAMLDLVCVAHAYAETNRNDKNLSKIAEILTVLSMVDISAPLELPAGATVHQLPVKSLQSASLEAVEAAFQIAGNK